MDFLDSLLNFYSISKDEYKILSRPICDIKLLDPTNIKGMDKVVDRINRAIQNKEKILIYGDYDCDGICSTSIIYKTFNLLNYHADYYIPSRYIDGYAINEKNVDSIAKKRFNLIICVDNGITAKEAINKASSLGIDVIVIDHHEYEADTISNPLAIIHPIYSDISPLIGSGGYMSLFVSAALLGQYDDYLVTLAGLSTISDLMSLKGYNRDVVRLALHNFKEKKYIQLKYLCSNLDVIDEKLFGLEIAPKINAVGRLLEDTSVNRLVKYLTSDDNLEIARLSAWINEVNDQRKEFTKIAIEKIDTKLFSTDSIVLLLDMKEGLAGLIANRLLNSYNKPCVIFVKDINNPDLIQGSIRSKEGFNITKAFTELKEYLVRGGGHAFAGGLTINLKDFENFKEKFNEIASKHKLEESYENIIDISLQDITLENYNIISTFAPFGMDFKEPDFRIKNISTKTLGFISDGKHLCQKLSMNSKLLGFNMPKSEVTLKPYINICGNYYLSCYKGFYSVDFRIKNYN